MLRCLRGAELWFRRSRIRNAASLCNVNRAIISVDLHLRSSATENCTANAQLARKSDASHPRNCARVSAGSASPQASVLVSTLNPALETDERTVVCVLGTERKLSTFCTFVALLFCFFLHNNEPTFFRCPIRKQV